MDITPAVPTQQVEFNLLHPLARFPRLGTPHAAGYDVSAIEGGNIPPMGQRSFRTGLSIKTIAPSMFIQLISRSGLGLHKQCYTVLGTIDCDFRGEIIVVLFNASPCSALIITPGQRISQMLFLPILHPTSRTLRQDAIRSARGDGCFGSTGDESPGETSSSNPVREERDACTLLVLEGCIGAGKTTLFKHLQTLLRQRNDVSFSPEPTELFSNTLFNGQPFDPLSQAYSGNQADYIVSQGYFIKTMTKKFIDLPPNKFVISDRHLESCRAFVQVRRDRYEITDYHFHYLLDHINCGYEAIRHLRPSQFTKVIVFVLDTPVETCLERIKARKRPEEIASSDGFWLEYNKRLRSAFLTTSDTPLTLVRCPDEVVLVNRLLAEIGPNPRGKEKKD
jgi:dUTP pyrophosphatase